MIRQLGPEPGTELSDEDLERLYAPPALARAAESGEVGRHVRANFLVSLDGAIEAGGVGASLDGGDDDLRVFMTLRALSDVVIVGATTVRAEDYGPPRLSAERTERRRRRGDEQLPVIAVITNTLSINPASKLFGAAGDGRRPIVVTSESAPADRRKALEKVADVLVVGEKAVDMGAAVELLAEQGLRRQLCEGGPTVFSSMLRAGLVDEVCLTVRTALAGPGHKLLTQGPPFEGLDVLRVTQLLAGEGVLLGRYAAGRG